MTLTRPSRRILYLVVAIGITVTLASASPAPASFPEAESSYLNDYANIVSQKHARMIKTELRDLRKKHGIEAVVLTVKSYKQYRTGHHSIEDFANDLFNDWGIGKKQSDNGVLILVSVKEQKIRIQLGSGFGSEYDQRMQEIIDDNMVPQFKLDNFSKGVVEGVEAVTRVVSKSPEELSTSESNPPDIQSGSYTLIQKILIGIGVIVYCVVLILCLWFGYYHWQANEKFKAGTYFVIAGVLLLPIVLVVLLILFGDSSGGEFGGGSTSGGGATGSW